MEMHGKLNLVDSRVTSDEFASDKQFNKLIVNDISEIDQATLDRETIVINKADDKIYTFNVGSDSWISTEFETNAKYDLKYITPLYIDEVKDIYNIIHLDSINTQLSFDPDLFNFGPIGSPIDFVIDFWMRPPEAFVTGPILYNGLNTGQVDLEVNKNLLITTNGTLLVKDPNYQDPPTSNITATDELYLNVHRPRLKSKSQLFVYNLVHVAIIRSGDTTYLAIDGKIEDSAPSVEYFHYDDVLFGYGYVGNTNYGIVNLRVSKNTDRGWTEDFAPPTFNPEVDANTDLLMDSTSNVLVDLTGNYSINEVGEPTVISQDRFYVTIPEEFNGSVISSNLNQDKLVLKLPDSKSNASYMFMPNDTPFTIIGLKDNVRYGNAQSTEYVIPSNSFCEFYHNTRSIITVPYIDTSFRRPGSLTGVLGFVDSLHVREGIVRLTTVDGEHNPTGYAVVSRTTPIASLDLDSLNNFYRTSNTYYNSPNTFSAGNDLVVQDWIFYVYTNHWIQYYGLYTGGWDLAAYSSTYGVRVRYGGYNIVVQGYDASEIGNHIHVIFGFYRGSWWVSHRNIEKTDQYSLQSGVASSSYTTFSRHMYGGSDRRFAMVRTRIIPGTFTGDESQSIINQSRIA